MRRRTGETFIPLLPPPGETGVPPSEEIPGQEQLLEAVLATATLGYIKQVNKSGFHTIPLSPTGMRTAAAVIADAIELSRGDVSIGPMTPKDLRQAIKDGLKRRDKERQRGKSVLRQLDEPSGPQGRQTCYDLAISEKIRDEGKLEAYNYLNVPKPASLRRLIALTDERVGVVPATAQESLTEALGLPHRPGDPYGVNRYLRLPQLENSAVIDRGEVAVRMIGSQSPDYDRRRPLGIDDLKLLAGILSDPGAEREVSAVAAAAAAELMGHQPELVEPARDALKDFGGQMRKAAGHWRSTAPEGTTESVHELVDLAQIFSGVPIVPLATQITWITKPEEITAGGVELPGKRHLWEKPQVLIVKEREVFLPSEATLAEAFIQLRSVGVGSDNLRRINEARRSWQKYNLVATRNPGLIAEKKNRLGQLFPEFADLIKLSPDQYPVSGREVAARLRKSGGAINDKELQAILQAVDQLESSRRVSVSASAVKRRIRFYQKCLGDYDRWEQITMSLDDAKEVGDSQLVDKILTERASEIKEEIKGLVPGLSRTQTNLEMPNIGTALYHWQTRPNQPPDYWQMGAIPQSIEEVDHQIGLVGRWLRDIENDEASPLSIGLPLDTEKLIDYLKARLEGLPASQTANVSPQAGRLMRAARTIEAGAADRPFSNPLKTLIAEELNRRYRRLTSYRKTVASMEEKEAELTKIEAARASFMSGEDEKAAALAGIDTPAKRKGVGALTRLKLVNREVRDNPDRHRSQLTAAQELIGLHRRTKTFTFVLPINSDGIPAKIESQRRRDLATGKRAVEWSDRDGPVSLAKGATAADIQRMLDILKKSFDEPNVFIPLRQAAGLTLGELMNAVSARVNVILAQEELPELIGESERLAAQLETIHQEKDQAEALARAKVLAKRIRGLEEELAGAPSRLIAEMRRQKLVLDLPSSFKV